MFLSFGSTVLPRKAALTTVPNGDGWGNSDSKVE